MAKIVKYSGEITDGDDHNFDDPEKYLEDALNSNKWKCSLMGTGNSGYFCYNLEHPEITNKYTLHVYLKPVKYRKGRKNPTEKQHQMQDNVDMKGYNALQSDTVKTLALGIYIDPTDTTKFLICAWNAFDWGKNIGTNPFNYNVDSKTLANGFVYGFSKELRGTNKVKEVFVFRPEFIHYYIQNKEGLHKGTNDFIITSPLLSTISLEVPRNKIIYGAPGTGKSFELRSEAERRGFKDDNSKRVTFHPNYSYQQFIGTYKPTPIYKGLPEGTVVFENDRLTRLTFPLDKEPLIDYSFTPGPFIELFIKAKKDPEEKFLLIIEEINRANVAAVFGDVFQLLDRNEYGESEYEINFSKDVSTYLKSQGITDEKIKLPSNFFIWATMNSADQGVMPLDAAFKRRWSFQYISLNENEDSILERDNSITFQGNKYNWNAFRSIINEKLTDLGVAEDKLIGPFFLNNRERNCSKEITNKLLLYLRDDILRHNPEGLFRSKTFSKIMKDYDKGEVFNNDINLPPPIVDNEKEEALSDPGEEIGVVLNTNIADEDQVKLVDESLEDSQEGIEY